MKELPGCHSRYTGLFNEATNKKTQKQLRRGRGIFRLIHLFSVLNSSENEKKIKY